MTALINAFWKICVFQKGPDRLPSSSILLILLVAADALLSWSSSMLLQPIFVEAARQAGEEVAPESGMIVITRVIVGLATTTALIWGLLAMVDHSSRLNQTLCAAFGTDLIITFVTAAALGLAGSVNPAFMSFAVIGTLFWSIAVLGFILHRAMEVSMGVGVMAGIFVITFSIAVSQVALGN